MMDVAVFLRPLSMHRVSRGFGHASAQSIQVLIASILRVRTVRSVAVVLKEILQMCWHYDQNQFGLRQALLTSMESFDVLLALALNTRSNLYIVVHDLSIPE